MDGKKDEWCVEPCIGLKVPPGGGGGSHSVAWWRRNREGKMDYGGLVEEESGREDGLLDFTKAVESLYITLIN